MKGISLFFIFLMSLTSLQAAIPTPDFALAFDQEKDARKWTPQHRNGTKQGFIMELVPQGDTIEKWKEMASHQITFTKQSLRKFVNTWKNGLLKVDPKLELNEETLKDGSIYVTYISPKADETSMRRFIKGKDGVYMLAYHVRPKLKNADIWKSWDDIIRTAYLLPNPEKKK